MALVDRIRSIAYFFLIALMVLVGASRENGEISAGELNVEHPKYIGLRDWSRDTLAGRRDGKFPQLVRSHPSHKISGTNFIYQGYAEAIPDSFKITAR